MAKPFDGISQQLDFTSGGEEGSSSSDNSSDYYTFRIRSPRFASSSVLNHESTCRTPRPQRHRSRSSTVSSPLQCTNLIPYASWRNLRLCDSPSTPKVGQSFNTLQMKQTCSQFWTQTRSKLSGGYVLLAPSNLAEPAFQVLAALLQH